MKKFGKLMLLGMCLFTSQVNAQDFAAKKKYLESQLTVQEKIDLLCAKAPAIDRLGMLRYDWWSECLHGVARNGHSTVFPKPIALGCTWDPDLLKRISTAISDEARVKYNQTLQKKGYSDMYEGLTFFSPTLNLARDPRWGRTSECFSEDPYLTGRMGVSFVQGLQGDDPVFLKLVATPKHFVANNEEDRRFYGSANMDEQSLREYYFPAFKAAVTEGKAKSVMGAYNALNGVPCCVNSFLLNDVLRTEWGFEGVVISDGSAIGKLFTHHKYVPSLEEGAALALKSGCDMSLRNEYRGNLWRAYQQGLIGQEDIDRAVDRVLDLRLRLGIDDFSKENPYSQLPDSLVECFAHRQLAIEAARKSMVLLKNDGLLPLRLDKGQIKRIALIGEACKTIYYGDYSGVSAHAATLWDVIQAEAKGKAEVEWISEQIKEELVPSNVLVRDEKYAYEGLGGFTGEYFDNKEMQGNPVLVRQDMGIDMVPQKDEHLKAYAQLAARWQSSLVLPATGKYTFSFSGTGRTRIYIDNKCLVDKWMDGSAKESFSVELKEGVKYPVRIECREMNVKSPVCLRWKKPVDEKEERTLEKVAKNSDVVILFLRDDNSSEGKDRQELALSLAQQELIKQVTEANPNTILLFGGGTALPYSGILHRLKALLNVWIGGQGEARAISDILFGKVNPSGKTSVTFYADGRQLPPMDDYKVKSGRSYQYFKGDVLFPFGYGLSYTNYVYSVPVLDRGDMLPGGSLTASVEVSNKGDYDGEEIVECYLSSPEWMKEGLKQKLVSFKRVFLKKGETRKVCFTIPETDLRRWNTEKKEWQVKAGQYELSIVPHSGIKNAVSFVVPN